MSETTEPTAEEMLRALKWLENPDAETLWVGQLHEIVPTLNGEPGRFDLWGHEYCRVHDGWWGGWDECGKCGEDEGDPGERVATGSLLAMMREAKRREA